MAAGISKLTSPGAEMCQSQKFERKILTMILKYVQLHEILNGDEIKCSCKIF